MIGSNVVLEEVDGMAIGADDLSNSLCSILELWGFHHADQAWRMVKSVWVNQAYAEITKYALTDGVAGGAGSMDHGVIGINGSTVGQADLLVVTPVTGRGIAHHVGVVMLRMVQAGVGAVAAEAGGYGLIEVWYFSRAMARRIA